MYEYGARSEDKKVPKLPSSCRRSCRLFDEFNARVMSIRPVACIQRYFKRRGRLLVQPVSQDCLGWLVSTHPVSATSTLLHALFRYLTHITAIDPPRRDAGPALETPPVDRQQLLARDSCSSFLYYATGNRKCSGVLVTINLAHRHDLFTLLWNALVPVTDRVTVEVILGDDDLDSMVFAVAPKRDVKKLQQSVPHLQELASPTRAESLPPGLVCLSESFALLEPLLPPAAIKIISEYPELLELVHFTDQNEQPIAGQADTPKKVLRFTFRLPEVTGNRTGDMRGGAKMIELALFYIELLHK